MMRRTTERLVPYAVFTDPELARVGLNEREAAAKGREFKVSRYEMKRNGRAREMGRPEGFIKILVDPAIDRILGAAILSAEAAEIIHTFVDLMNAGASPRVVGNSLRVHPTLAEAVQSALNSL